MNEKQQLEQLKGQLQNTQAVADVLANRIGETEKALAQVQVAYQLAINTIKQLEDENQKLKEQIAQEGE
jgi:hypothetical protein